MQNRRHIAGAVTLFALITSLSVAGCGGSSEPAGPIQQGHGNLGGSIGDITKPPAPGDYPIAQPASGVSAEAPLGTDPQYNMQLLTGQQGSFGAIKGGSAVVMPSSGFDVVDITMMPDGTAANWSLTEASFEEGQTVDLWVKFNVYGSGSQDLVRSWISSAINLNFTEGSQTYNTEGEYTVKLDYTIPFVGAQNDATFTVNIASGGTTKSSAPFIYDVTARQNVTLNFPVDSDGDNSLPTFSTGYAQLAWEDLLANSDYDYNDFVARLKIEETRDPQNRLVQIKLTVKAVARGAGYTQDFQLNMNGAFPGATVTAVIDQYYDNQFNADGSPKRHGSQRTWTSSNGVSLPIFAPTKNAIPAPSGSFASNTVTATKYIDGDYAVATITFSQPIPQGQYTPAPYKPELRVRASDTNIYIIGLWKKKGDQVDSNGRPLAFIVPDTYAWPLERVPIWNCYSGFNAWINWINDGSTTSSQPEPIWFDSTPIPSSGYFKKIDFLP